MTSDQVEHACWVTPHEEVQNMFAGIDWGGHRHQLAVVDLSGAVLVNRPFNHDSEGVDQLVAELARQGGPATPVAIERSEGVLVERLLAESHPVYPVAPRVSARARERYQAATRKDDRFDAFVLADSLRLEIGRWRPLSSPSDPLPELRVLVRDRRRVLEHQQAVEAQLRASLDAYHPGPTRMFSSLDRGIALAFIRNYPTPQAAAHVGVARMERFLARNGYTGRVPPALLVERLRSGSIPAGDGTTAGRAWTTLRLVDHLELLNRDLKAFEQRIEEVFQRHPDAGIFASFPAAGPIIAPALLAEIGEDRDRLPEVGALLAEAGLAPVTLASGRSSSVRMRRACNPRLRDTFNSWAYTLKRINPPSRDRYLAARERNQHAHRALRSVGASWGRVLWRCWQDHRPYDPKVHRPA